MSDKLYLSASRLKTLDTCSWVYYCNYVLKMPQSSNDGANRGSVAHNVLECLLRKDKKVNGQSRGETVQKILIDNPRNSNSVNRLVIKYAKQFNVADEENLNLIYGFLQIALKNNFYLSHLELQEPEYEFIFGDPEVEGYRLKGFIDKHGICDKTKTLEIWDYKTSKAKFPKGELDNNLQALIYSLIMWKKYPDYKNSVKFLFLKFPRAPLQEISFSTDQLSGFEEILKSSYEYLQDFGYEKAKSNLAFNNQKNSWLCGKACYPGEEKEDGTLKWCCQHKFARKYYAVVNEAGDNLRTAYNLEDLKEQDGEKVLLKSYGGCPAFF